jgi:hypothetical protein
VIFLHNWILHFLRIPGICNLYFLDLQNNLYDFSKFMSILELFKPDRTQAGHVAEFYWRVPVGPDQDFWPLDLHKIYGLDLTGSRLGSWLGV